MATRAPARPPQRARAAGPTGPSPSTVPAQQLAPRPLTHLRDGCVLTGLGLAGAGAVNGTGHPAWDVPILLGGVLGGTATVVAGERARRRGQAQDRLVEALAPLLGVRQLDRRTVQLRAWSRGWPGQPGKIVIRYAPGASDSDPQWKAAVLEVAGARLLAPYEVASHDQRRCRLVLQVVPVAERTEEQKPAVVLRAERAISELLGPSAKVVDVVLDGEELRAVEVTHQAAAKLAVSGYRTRVERVISTMMPGRWRAVWNLEGDSVRFELRPTLPASVWLPAQIPTDTEDLLLNYRNVAVPYAIDEDGHELVWNPARVPQLMLTGGTGTGKTSTAHALLGKVTQYGWPVWVLDAKRVEFLGFRDWPNVQIVAGSVPHQVALVHQVKKLVEYRYQLIESGRTAVTDFEPLVVIFDEFAEFRANLMAWYAQIKQRGDPAKPPTLSDAASIARLARTARVHVILATQRPDAEFLGGEMRDNFGQRISMGRLSPQGAMMMWDNPAVGVSLPRDRTGRAMSTLPDGRVAEVQCFRFPDMNAPEGSPERELLEAIRPAESRHPRLVIAPPEETLDLDGGATELTFRHYAEAPWAKASERPDLDRVAHVDDLDPAQRRALASTLASLGISDAREIPPARPSLRLVGGPGGEPASALGASPEEAPDVDVDELAGYGEAVPVGPTELAPGDLVEVEEGAGVWGVVEGPPEDDVTCPGMVAISWRGDGDETGSLSLDEDSTVLVRRPLEEDDA